MLFINSIKFYGFALLEKLSISTTFWCSYRFSSTSSPKIHNSYSYSSLSYSRILLGWDKFSMVVILFIILNNIFVIYFLPTTISSSMYSPTHLSFIYLFSMLQLTHSLSQVSLIKHQISSLSIFTNFSSHI